MDASDVTQRLTYAVTEPCSAVGARDDGDKWISLLKVAEIILLSDLFPGKTVSFAESKLFEIRMDFNFMLL
jgi:hypothetical protein